MARPEPLWTLDDLGAQVAVALAVGYDGQRNGRVRDVPDRRTIRYYTTLGLIDRPVELRGRTALYGRRHLLQLVAIKRLQARGLSLAEVQHQLLGLTDTALGRIARRPADMGSSARSQPPEAPPREAATGRRAAAFWSTPPAPPAEPATAEEPAARHLEECPREADLPLQGIRLSMAVTLLLAASRPVEEDDIEALRAAAGPLLKLLDKRRLLRPRAERNQP
jgi:DNA-binding transcriptional MerR regulator